MIDRKYLFVLLFLISMISISAVSAVEDITSDMTSADANSVVLEESINDNLFTSSDEFVLDGSDLSLVDDGLVLDGNNVDLVDGDLFLEDNKDILSLDETKEKKVSDKNDEESSDSEKFDEKKSASNVVISPISSSFYGGNVVVNFSVDNKSDLSFEVKNSKGIILKSGPVKSDSLIFKGLTADTYTITIRNDGNDSVYGSSASRKFSVNKYKSVITASKVVTVYSSGKYLTATLKDQCGNLLSGFRVSIKINGKTRTFVTNSKGQVKLSTNGLSPKSYVAQISFSGNEKYCGAVHSVKVLVKKAKLRLVAKSKTYKRKKKTIQYTVILKTNSNKAMKNIKLTLKVNGKTYKLKTNKKGKASFKINNLRKNGKYKLVVKFAGNKYYQKISKKARIIVRRKH